MKMITSKQQSTFTCLVIHHIQLFVIISCSCICITSSSNNRFQSLAFQISSSPLSHLHSQSRIHSGIGRSTTTTGCGCGCGSTTRSTRLYISNLFKNDNDTTPQLPRDVKEAVSKCREAVQKGLEKKLSRMVGQG